MIAERTDNANQVRSTEKNATRANESQIALMPPTTLTHTADVTAS